MILTGNFKTQDNTYTYNVQIGTGQVTQQIEDPTENIYETPNDLHVMFDMDPVTITTDRTDLTKRIIISQCTINLVTNKNLTDTFLASNNRSIPVSITRNGNICFYGFVDPLQFDQPMAHHWEPVQLNATDPLGALEQLNVGDLQNISASSQKTSWEIITAILNTAGITSISDNVNATVKAAMQSTWFNLAQFYGDNESDYATLNEVLEELCKYWNLYVSYYNKTAHINCTINAGPQGISISNFKNYAADESTSISTDDAYTKVEVTCDIDPVDDLVVSFDDDDWLYSDYNNYTRYMTELISEMQDDDDNDAFGGFKELVQGFQSGRDESYTVDNFVYVKRNDLWDFGPNGYTALNYADQRDYLTWLKNNRGKGILLSFGRSNKLNKKDNSFLSNINMQNYMLISVNGTYDDTSNGGTTMGNDLHNASPVCKYKGLTANILTPADSNTTNYIVINGKIKLNPLQDLTGPHWSSYSEKITNTYNECYTIFDRNSWVWDMTLFNHTVPLECDFGWGYYQQYWERGSYGVHGDLGIKKNYDLQYEYSSIGESADKISKLSILECQLKVGTDENAKYCVEHLWEGEQGVGNFEWMTQAQFNAIKAQYNLGNDAVPSFTIGIDPKIDDYIVGQQFDISNNVNYSMNLNSAGTAIPIKQSDRLGGVIEFTILGPYNSTWVQIGRVHHGWAFWGHSHWSDETVNVMQHIQSIMLQDLKITVESDNGLVSRNKISTDRDLVYASDMNPLYTEKLEDEIKVSSPLTPEECTEYGMKYQISNSYIYNTDNTPFKGFDISQQGEDPEYVRPEHCLVDYLYREYCGDVAKIVTTSVMSNILTNGMNGTLLNDEMMNYYITGIYPEDTTTPFRIMSYAEDLKKHTIDIKLREYKTYNATQI